VQEQLECLILHVLHKEHQEWIQVLWKHQFSDVVGPLEVVCISVVHFLLHVSFKALWELFNDFIDDIVDLLNLTTKTADKMLFSVETMIFNKVSLLDLNCLTFKDNVSLNLISLLLKFKIFGSNLSS
jgi:hypothetical protein